MNWSKDPEATEFWPDKLRVEVRGRVEWPSNGSFQSYLTLIAPSAYFTARPTVGRRFRADVRYGPGVTGDLRITMTSQGRADELVPGHAVIKLELNLNPTIVRALAVRRNGTDHDDLSLYRFFSPLASVAEAFNEGIFADPAEIPLDGAENVLLSMVELGGATRDERLAARNTFLATFETKLRSMADDMLRPRPTVDDASERAPVNYCVTLDWGGLVLRQAELYVERRADDPVSTVHRLYDRALDLARRIKGQKFWDVPTGGRPVPTTFAVSQNDGYPHLVMPLTGTRNVELSVYAKTNRRVRFEVRYKSKFGHHLRACSTSDDRLTSLLLRLSDNAATRLPWRALARASSVPPEVDVAEVPDLIAHLVDATHGHPDLFRPVIRQILMTGGLFDNEDRHPGIGAAIRRLVRLGVLWRWNTQQKEERNSRRYGLTDRYAAVRLKMIGGFAPADRSDWPASDR